MYVYGIMYKHFLSTRVCTVKSLYKDSKDINFSLLQYKTLCNLIHRHPILSVYCKAVNGNDTTKLSTVLSLGVGGR